MPAVLAILTAVAGPLEKLIEASLADTYDAEVEKQAMLDLTRALYDERLKRALAEPA